MIIAALVLALAQVQTGDSLLVLAERQTPAALVAQARAHPLELRDAIGRAFERAVNTSRVNDRERALRAAAALAQAHAIAWQDSFFIRQVGRFTSESLAWRRTKVTADSLRRAGVEAYGSEGVAAATLLWRRSARAAASIADTAALAAVLGNIAAGFHRNEELDSARVYLERSRDLARRVGDVRVEANAIGTLATLSARENRLEEARNLHDRAAVLRARIGDDRGAAADHQNMGLIASHLGQLDEAVVHIDTALAMNRRAGRHDLVATNLFNLAGLASTAGDMDRASRLYADALRLYRREGLRADAADALHGLGRVELARGDYPAALARLREAVEQYRVTGPVTFELAARGDAAAALLAMGEPQAALDELRAAEIFADSAGVAAGARARLVLARADLAVVLNRFEQAEELYGEASRMFRADGDAVGDADARQGNASLQLERENWIEAEQLLNDAMQTFTALGHARSAAITRMLLGSAASGRGDIESARARLRMAVGAFADVGDPVAEAAALGELAHVELEAGFPLRSDSLYAAALARVASRPAPGVTWRLRFGRGLAARARRALNVAADELYAAAADVERASGRLRLPERRAWFRTDKWEVYAQLAVTERRRGRSDLAFAASERMRAREMLELLQLGRIAVPNAPSHELAAREQSVRSRIGILTQQLEPQTGGLLLRGPEMRPHAAATRETLARLQQEYADLLLEMRERAPNEADLVETRAVSWRDIAVRLPDRTAMIEYLASDSAVIAFVITRDTLTSIDLGIRRHDLARLTEFARAMIERVPAADATPWHAPLRRLHEHLIGPIMDGGLLADVTRLVIVPHAELHYLPFAALIDSSDRFLIERYTLSYAPSAAVWMNLGERRTVPATRGVLALAPRTDMLPASAREVAAVERLMGSDVTTLVGARASEAEFHRVAGSHRVLHLATNGVLNRHNPLFSYVDLAMAAGHDGRLSVHEIFGLHLAADLVVLSACETGLGSGALADVPPGDDWVGLTRAFLHAGTADVIATLWSVDDRSSAMLMERFYERYALASGPAESLAQAQRRLLRVSATAHPFHWAGVVLVGRGR